MTIPLGNDVETLTCPFCDCLVRIQIVMDGVYAISADNPDCKACMLAVSRLSDFLDNSSESWFR